jgi:hypothetical protein
MMAESGGSGNTRSFCISFTLVSIRSELAFQPGQGLKPLERHLAYWQIRLALLEYCLVGR